MVTLGQTELVELGRRGLLTEVAGHARDTPVVAVELDTALEPPTDIPLQLSMLPAVIIGMGPASAVSQSLVDVLADADEASQIVDGVADNPLASVALALLLRHSERRTVAEGLVAESTTYSMLQAGPEFTRWLTARSPRKATRPETHERVQVRRDDSTLTITLTRVDRHNAFDTEQIEALVGALRTAVTAVRDEPELRVLLQAQGPSFSSGGDLDGFGSFPDPATAHAIRLARSAGELIASIAHRVDVHLHGWCVGAGIEIPAFASRVIADPTTTISLPEVALGLVPGAGGTVSLPRRIGRHRTALLALTSRQLDADTALQWGLADAVAPRGVTSPFGMRT